MSIELDLKRQSDGQRAMLTGHPGSLYVSLIASTPDFELKEMSPEFTLAFRSYLEYRPFQVSKQRYYDADGEPQITTVGTSASGSFTYLAAALTVLGQLGNFGDQALEFGIGTGYGRLNASGTAIFTPDDTTPPTATPEPFAVDSSSIGGLLLFLYAPMKSNLGMGLRTYTGVFKGQGVKVTGTDFVIYVSWVFKSP